MKHPLISICIPVYNGEKYLNECLDSCLSQTFMDFEIVICDDGSGDRSIEIIESYLNKLPGIRLYKNEKNLGLVGNWNKCLELAKGTWIKMLFQDDAMAANCLEKFSKNFNEATQLLVCRRNFLLGENADPAQVDYYANKVRTLENTGHPGKKVFSPALVSKLAAKNMGMNFIAEPSLSIFRKSVVETIGYFDTELRQICDLEFFLRLSVNFGLSYLPEKLCVFRIHGDSTTEKNKQNETYQQQYLESLSYAAKLLTKTRFKAFREQISIGSRLKIALMVKYKSYLAFKGIRTEEDNIAYNALFSEFGHLFFKNPERPLFKMIALIKK